MSESEQITVLITTSPVFCNPSTELVDETYAQLRKQLPKTPVILLMDGVHPEQPHLITRYQRFKDAIKQKDWDNFTILEFPFWNHVSGMMCNTLLTRNLVQTPLLLYMEHDSPFCDSFIDWAAITNTLLAEEVSGIVFDRTGETSSAHGKTFTSRHGVRLTEFYGYVDFPQIAKTESFKQFLAKLTGLKTYMGNSHYTQYWRQQAIPYTMYAPQGDRRRCYHTHGRQRGTTQNEEALVPYIETVSGRQYVTKQPYHP